MKSTLRFRMSVIVLCFLPLFAMLLALAVLSRSQVDLVAWEQHRIFWGGNPNEVYSHWLDMVVMSGNAVVLAWLLSSEAFFRRSEPNQFWLVRLSWLCAATCVTLSSVWATVLDLLHGEGTVIFALLLWFVPMLAASYYVLRRLAAVVQWKLGRVAGLSAGYAGFHTISQLMYEPSGTGAPNVLVVVFWVGTIGVASTWALATGIRTGWLKEFIFRLARVASRPVAWGSAIVLVLSIGVPIKWQADRFREPRHILAMNWLDDLESRLDDAYLERLRREQGVAPNRSRIPLSDAARALFEDGRLTQKNSLRIFIPLNDSNYLFLNGNASFQYCDVRTFRGDGTEQMDQSFIDKLLARGGTAQTGRVAALRKRYLAGRVLKDDRGAVKAICIINSEEF